MSHKSQTQAISQVVLRIQSFQLWYGHVAFARYETQCIAFSGEWSWPGRKHSPRGEVLGFVCGCILRPNEIAPANFWTQTKLRFPQPIQQRFGLPNKKWLLKYFYARMPKYMHGRKIRSSPCGSCVVDFPLIICFFPFEAKWNKSFANAQHRMH